MLGMVDGTRKRGKQRICWVDTSDEDAKINLKELKEAVKMERLEKARL